MEIDSADRDTTSIRRDPGVNEVGDSLFAMILRLSLWSLSPWFLRASGKRGFKETKRYEAQEERTREK